MSNEFVFRKDGRTWQRTGDLAGLTSMDMVELRIKLMDVVDLIDERVDAYSAEGQLSFEIGSRMNRLASRAHAAGMLAAMWHDQNSRFYKERLVLEQMKKEQRL